jgi:hypothetical protein
VCGVLALWLYRQFEFQTPSKTFPLWSIIVANTGGSVCKTHSLPLFFFFPSWNKTYSTSDVLFMKGWDLSGSAIRGNRPPSIHSIWPFLPIFVRIVSDERKFDMPMDLLWSKKIVNFENFKLCTHTHKLLCVKCNGKKSQVKRIHNTRFFLYFLDWRLCKKKVCWVISNTLWFYNSSNNSAPLIQQRTERVRAN